MTDARPHPLGVLRGARADRIGHSGGDLLRHLQGVSALLASWGARPALRDAGLFHSAYGTEFFDQNALKADERDRVRAAVGGEAEALAWLWSRLDRASLRSNVGRTSRFAVRLRDGSRAAVSALELSDLVTLWIADALEQMPRRGRRSARTLRDALAPLLPLASGPAAAAEKAAFAELPRPIVHLYAACWNEAAMIPYFLRHYEPWVDRFVIFDDGSTDGSREMLEGRAGVEVRPLVHSDPESLILSLRDLYDHAWKESRGAADWVVVVNMDEHLYLPDIAAYLEAAADAGVTAVPALGYEMVGEDMPASDALLHETVRLGAPRARTGKLALFSPDEVSEIGYHVGRHRARPRGRIRYPARDELLLLHFKCLSLSRLVARHAEQDGRRRERDRAEGWGQQYGWSKPDAAAWMAEMKRAAVEVRSITDPHRQHDEPRWWRPSPRQLARDFARVLRLRGYLPARREDSV